MPERTFVIASSLEEALREGSWICKRPSDQGPWVFIYLRSVPRSRFLCYVIEILSTARNGNSRQGRVVFIAQDVLKELMIGLTSATWLRDRNGDPWARGIKSSVGVFDAYLVPAAYSTSFGDIPARIIFEPAEGSAFRALKQELANWLETDDEAEIARAKAAPFDPEVGPCTPRARMIAERLSRR